MEHDMKWLSINLISLVLIFSGIVSTHVTERYKGDKMMYSADSWGDKKLSEEGGNLVLLGLAAAWPCTHCMVPWQPPLCTEI